MARRSLAILLIFSWIILSGFDVVEDLHILNQSELKNLTNALIPRENGSGGILARNIVESADRMGSRCANLLEQGFETTAIYTPSLSQKVSKLHKIHQVFLI